MKYVEAMISIPHLEDEELKVTGATESMDALRKALTNEDGHVTASAELATAESALDDWQEAAEGHECYSPVIPHLIPVGSTEDINVQMERAGFLNGEVVVILRESDFLQAQYAQAFRALSMEQAPDFSSFIEGLLK